MEHVQVLIAGGGIGGLSAAIWCRRLGLSCLLLESKDVLGGQLSQIHNEIPDFPPRVYPNGAALLEELLGHPAIRELRPRLGETILRIDAETHEVHTSHQVYRADYLIIATGVSPNIIPALADCPRVLSPWFSTTSQAATVEGQDIAVIGGGDRALESASNLAAYARHMYLLVRSDHLRARSEWVERVNRLPNLQIMWETEASGYSMKDGRIRLDLRSEKKEAPKSITVDWVLPRIGVRGNSQAFASLPVFDEHYLKTDQTQRSVPEWIYAIGDVANGAAYSSISLAVGQAMKAVKHISLGLQHQHENID
ncbi:NAD(P)/FAD-dependent oxidoreductase [Brevibacillus panacihumi]|uniref:NAD(P)/FAD-dependent oxidoreductase n=1 Tax=Brevibacillus panacihumi TaxID=497735 RepID=A0A3M8D1B0_9BACL|nr:NAD(P)/FAD-dependent oxidoreductase [Brevibacillus panacihumi]RNB80945.1 NAD(P)/FAD-dependent oxidoreductase [Brevibacillus panacihumi]